MPRIEIISIWRIYNRYNTHTHISPLIQRNQTLMHLCTELRLAYDYELVCTRTVVSLDQHPAYRQEGIIYSPCTVLVVCVYVERKVWCIFNYFRWTHQKIVRCDLGHGATTCSILLAHVGWLKCYLIDNIVWYHIENHVWQIKYKSAKSCMQSRHHRRNMIQYYSQFHVWQQLRKNNQIQISPVLSRFGSMVKVIITRNHLYNGSM